jgi:asparagine synthase (glutamine-hydrolysing)
MCGIAGFFCKDRIEQAVIKQMTDAIAHRGPDAEGFFYKDNIALGHRRLSIIDLSAAANQPMYTSDNRRVIVFNGEVYNYREIANELSLKLKTHSDTEVLLESFAALGPEAISKWNGMFAIAVYDKITNKLFLIRDRLGIKPVYYFQSNDKLFFASELKALTAVASVRSELTINQSAITSFLQLGYIPGPATIYNEIKKLPAGHYASFDGTEFIIRPYWQAAQRIESLVISNENEVVKKLEELLLSSVKYRMIADVPFGAFLSGGIDSSVVTAMAQRVSETPLKTFSIAFNEAKYNESQYSRAVAAHLGTDHHEFIVSENDALGLVEHMLDAYDEPYADSSGIPTMMVSKLARQHVTMVLSGDGGDELFMGYGAYNWAKRLNHPLIKVLHKPISWLMNLGNERLQRAAHVLHYPNKNTLPEHIFSQEQYFFSSDELRSLLKNQQQPVTLYYSEAMARKLSAAEQQAFFDLKYYLCDDLLTKVDIASMQYALEVRVPLLDYRIIEFSLNLSEELKKKDNVSKYLLKQVLYKYVPQEIFNRPKWGFSIPLPKWLRSELKYLIDQYLNNDMMAKHQLMDVNRAAYYRDAFLQGKNYYYNRVWAMMILHRWIEKHTS